MTSEVGETPVYRSIFLSPRWAHQRYFGWITAVEAPGVRLLQRRRGPLTRNLILLTAEGRDSLSEILQTAEAGSALSEVFIHDFDRVLGDSPSVPGLRLHEATAGERLLNVATVVVDLTLDEKELFRRMTGNYRREIRQAEAAGARVEVHDHPPEALLQRFTRGLETLAAERGLDRPKIAPIRQMFTCGDSVLLVSRIAGIDCNYAHLYTADRQAYFMNGVNLSRASDGSGKLIQWVAMQALRERGYDWYDLGGVRSRQLSDGIYNFKRRFGGQFVSLGVEWRHAPAIATTAVGVARTLRDVQRLWRRRVVAG